MKYLLFILCSSFMSCQSPAQDGGLPAKRLPDFSLSYHLDGGMRYYSEDLFISKDSCIYDVNDGGKRTISRFKLTEVELDALYQSLQKNEFDRIGFSDKGMVYDRGGVSISITCDNNKKRIHVSDAQSSFVNGNRRKEWNAVCSYLLSLVAKKTNGA